MDNFIKRIVNLKSTKENTRLSKKLIVVGVLAVSCGAVGAYYYHTVSQDKTASDRQFG